MLYSMVSRSFVWSGKRIRARELVHNLTLVQLDAGTQLDAGIV